MSLLLECPICRWSTQPTYDIQVEMAKTEQMREYETIANKFILRHVRAHKVGDLIDAGYRFYNPNAPKFSQCKLR